ncbi:hypothetical protein [Massilia violaceinigra]|uniref:hypothetical protein n=1 Tax=Massilia violaceinigra TaxID=2045208 RepID=UPI0012FD57DF|nr:hypothetical protein [Massilia violaceinigra]
MIHSDSTCFVLENGVASRTPLVYNNTRSPVRIQSLLGTSDAAMIAFEWATPDAPHTDYSILQYDQATKYWTLKNSSPNRQVIRYPTTHCHWRQAAPWFLHGVFLGGDAGGEAQVSFIAAPTPPSVEYAGSALTYQRGDVVWQSRPVAGGTLGSLCLTPGTQGTLNGGATKGSIASASDQLVVSNSADLAVGQYITIAGVSGIKQITAISGKTVTIGVGADATVVDAPVAFENATFTTFGEAHAPSASYDVDWSLLPADRFTTVTVTGKTMTLPAAPSDGQTHDIKSTAGVTTTVNTSGGTLAIDGGATATVADGQNRTFRYSAAAWPVGDPQGRAPPQRAAGQPSRRLRGTLPPAPWPAVGGRNKCLTSVIGVRHGHYWNTGRGERVAYRSLSPMPSRMRGMQFSTLDARVVDCLAPAK